MSMSTPAPIAPPSPPGLGRAGAARSGAPPGELSFATLLQNDRARTAVAEGQNKNEAPRRTSAEHRDERSDARLEHGAQPAAKVDERPEAAPQPEAQTEPQDPAVDPALQSPVPPTPAEPVSAPVVATTTPFADAVAEARAAVVAPVVVDPAAAEATPTAPAVPVAPVQTTDAETAVPATPAVPVATTTDATEQAPVQATQPATEAEATTETDDSAPAVPAEDEAPADEAKARPGRSGDAPGHQADHREDKGNGNGPVNANAKDPNANANARAFETPSRTGVTPSRGVGGTDSAPVVEPAAPAAPAPTAPATSAAPQTEAAPATSAPAPVRGATTLQHLARTVDAAMQMGHARGITRAKLHLHPAELGAIELHLRHTASGMTARVVADSPEAVAVLQQASSDLRRSLEQAGITLTGLDIGARADQQAEQRTFAGAFDTSSRDDDRSGARGRGTGRQNGDTAEPTLDQTIRARLPLPGGALVDVIA